MFKLFKKRDGAEQAKQLSIYQRRALAYPAPAPGSLAPSAIDAMENDSMVQTALTVKKLGVLAADWKIDCPDVTIKSFVEEAIERMEGSPNDILRQAMDAFAKGWSIQEMVFEQQGSRIWLKAAHPKDPSLFGMDVDAFGNVEGLRLTVPGEAEVTLPRAKFILWANRGGYGRPKGRSDLECAYPHWSAKQTLLAAWKLHLERFAMPTVFGKYDSALSSDDRQALVNALKDLQNNTSLVFPNEVEISTLQVSKETSTGFMDALDFHNREIARSVLGQTLTTDEGRRVGSLAMGKVHLQVLLLQLQALRTELADTVITEQVLRPLVALNFGGEAPVPRFKFMEARLEAFTTGAV